MCRFVISLLLAGVVIVTTASSQPIQSGFYAISYDSFGETLWHVSLRGKLTSLWFVNWTQDSLFDVRMHVDNERLVVSQGGSLLLFDPAKRQVVSTLYRTNTKPNFIRGLDSTGSGDYVVLLDNMSSRLNLVRISPDGSSVRTLVHAASSFRPTDLVRDYSTGDLLVSLFAASFIDYIVGFTENGAARGVLVALSRMNPPHSGIDAMESDHEDGSILFVGKHLYRLNGTSITTVSKAGGMDLKVDRSPGNGAIAFTAYDDILRVKRTGEAVTTIDLNCGNGLRSICFAQDRNLVSRRLPSPGRWRFDMHFPGEIQRSYVLGLSMSGLVPGFKLGPRTVSLVPDALLYMSLMGYLHPYLTGNIGKLGASGRASATLDLSRLGSIMNGARIWAATVTLDPKAPQGIATVSKPVLIVP